MKLKGWVYVVNCPEDWSNTGKGRNYQILDAPHVMAQNKNPKWECVECGGVVEGRGLEPGECFYCLMKNFMDECKKTPWHKIEFQRDDSIWRNR